MGLIRSLYIVVFSSIRITFNIKLYSKISHREFSINNLIAGEHPDRMCAHSTVTDDNLCLEFEVEFEWKFFFWSELNFQTWEKKAGKKRNWAWTWRKTEFHIHSVQKLKFNFHISIWTRKWSLNSFSWMDAPSKWNVHQKCIHIKIWFPHTHIHTFVPLSWCFWFSFFLLFFHSSCLCPI